MLDAQRGTVFDMAAKSAAAAVRGNADDAPYAGALAPAFVAKLLTRDGQGPLPALKPVGTGIGLLLVAYLGQPKGDSSRLALPPGKSPSRPCAG
jgi:hypothetical protein